MSSQVFARKYRPQDFETVLGQETTVTILKNALTQKRFHHAYLFTGPRGVGKTTLARIFAKALNCEKGPTATPCGTCSMCEEITRGGGMTVIEIDGASNTSVDDVRELRENIRYIAPGGRYKIYIIDEVHMLSNAAFNALLKTLEEPPPHALFIFATTEPQKMPITVLSRLLRFDLKPIPRSLIVNQLQTIAKQENVKVDEKALYLIAREAQGGMRDALSLFDQLVSFATDAGEVTLKTVESVLGQSSQKVLMDLLAAILEQNAQASLKIVQEAFSSGVELKRLASDLLEYLRHLMVAQISDDPELFDLPAETIQELKVLAQKASSEDLDRLFRIHQRQLPELLRSSMPKILWDTLVLRLVQVGSLRTVDELVASLGSSGGILPGTPSQNLRNSSLPSSGKAGSFGSSHGANPDSPPDTPHRVKAMNHGSQPVAPRAAASDMSSVSQGSPVQDSKNSKDSNWPTFLNFLREKRPQLFSLVTQGSLKSLGENELKLQFPPKAMAITLLQDPDRLALFKDVLKNFFGKNIEPRFESVGDIPATVDMGKVVDEAISVFGPSTTRVHTIEKK